MTPDPLLHTTAVTVADHLTEMADRIRRGRPVGALDANTADHAARLLKELVAADAPPTHRLRDTPRPRPTFGPFDERRGGARRP